MVKVSFAVKVGVVDVNGRRIFEILDSDGNPIDENPLYVELLEEWVGKNLSLNERD